MRIAFTDEGEFWQSNYGTTTWTEVALPSGIAAVDPVKRASKAQHNKQTYLAGKWDEILIWTHDQQLYQAGITATATAPTAALGAGTGITATGVFYKYTMAHLIDGVVIHESDASSASATALNPANQSVDISGLPTTHTNARVTHKRLYRSDNGGEYRFVANIVLATSTYSDTTATLALGAVMPTNHGTPPYGLYCVVAKNRLWIAGDPENPHYIYFSELNSMESFGEENFVKTLKGEKVTGLGVANDQIIVFTDKDEAYEIIGYGLSSFEVNRIPGGVKCISHFSIVNINETLWFASDKGVYTYRGAFKFQMEDLQTYWRTGYEADVDAYQDCEAVHGKKDQIYKLLIPDTTSFAYVAAYEPIERGEQPYWSFDTKDRQDKSLGFFYPDYDQMLEELHTGSCDGHIREDDVAADNDDDGDTGNKKMIITTGMNSFGDPGGDIEEGKSLTKLKTFLQSENNAWTLYALGGDEDAITQEPPDNATEWWKEDVAASASAGIVPKSQHEHNGVERVSGRNFGISIHADDAVGMRYRGWNPEFGSGPGSRPVAD